APSGIRGRLVTQEELREAVWPTTVVSESVLRGAIRELREVLGDNADAVQFVETIPHRGYRFIAPFSIPPPVASGQESVTTRQKRGSGSNWQLTTNLVGRDAELAPFQEWLESALRGARQVVLVTGEPGI